MGGKSSFVRAVALLVLLAQIGSFVPADAFSLTLTDAIHTCMGARDNLFTGESTFMVEVSETARILRAATPRSLVILDELGRGTSTHDGAAIAQAVLTHVVEDTRCLTLFITHYQSLSRVADGLGGGRCTNLHMRFSATRTDAATGRVRDVTAEDDDEETSQQGNEVDAGQEEITFLYEPVPGVAHRSYGLNVARLARIPPKVLGVAARKSRELELAIKRRRLEGAARLLASVLSSSSDSGGGRAAEGGDGDGDECGGQQSEFDHLISSIEQL